MGLKCPKCGNTEKFHAVRHIGAYVDVTVDGNNEILEEDDPDLDYDDPEGPYFCPECETEFDDDVGGLGPGSETPVPDSPGGATRQVVGDQPRP
jgi:hypothetical protein